MRGELTDITLAKHEESFVKQLVYMMRQQGSMYHHFKRKGTKYSKSYLSEVPGMIPLECYSGMIKARENMLLLKRVFNAYFLILNFEKPLKR